jgi:thiosulfate/3-mercaptopyruvate sulfurtransferase
VFHDTILSTDTLAANLDAGWVIVDCRYDLHNGNWGRDRYRDAHIPGAVYADLAHDLAGPATGRNGRHPLPALDAMAATFGRLGIDSATQVVVYDQDSGIYASRLWWMLRYAGHPEVAVLDGGWAKWTHERRPIHSGDEYPRPTHFDVAAQPDLLVDVKAVAKSTRDPRVLLLDARAPERFEGRSEPLDRLAGHIPGADNHFHKENVAADGTMLPPDVLREQFTKTLGEHSPEHTIMYCGSGVTACYNLLAMERAGLSGARLYVGSWSEWSSDPDRPIETGPPRR